MLRGERCCSCGGGRWDDDDDGCCCDDDSNVRAEPVLEVEFAVAGMMVLFDAGGPSRDVTVCRRRTPTTGGAGGCVGADADADDEDTDDEDVVIVVLVWALVEDVLLLLFLGGAGGEEGETGMPKGVSSIFTLEEDATFLAP